MDGAVTTSFAHGNNVSEPSHQLGGSVPAVFLGCICMLGICTNLVIVWRVLLTYVKAKENIHAGDAYLCQKAAFDILLLLGSPFYVISVWNGYEVTFFPSQCRILVSIDFLAILLTNHVIIAIGFERYGRRTVQNGKPLSMTPRDAFKHCQANVLYSLMLCVGIVFVADRVSWREVPSCGYNWPEGQNYHAMVFILLFAIVYCITYFFFLLWGIDLVKPRLFKSPRATERWGLHISAEERRRDKAALVSLFIHFCCWTPFWCYHMYLVKQYYRVRPTIHLPGGFYTEDIFVTSLMYASASTNIFPSAILITDWAPKFWFTPLNGQSNVLFFHGDSSVPDLRVNDNTCGSTVQIWRNNGRNHLTTVSDQMLELSHTERRDDRRDQPSDTKASHIVTSPRLPSTSC